MLISSYNQKALGDVMIIYTAPDAEEQDVVTKGNFTRIFDPKTDTTLVPLIKMVRSFYRRTKLLS